jgi:truncated hemoglobin YjbI
MEKEELTKLCPKSLYKRLGGAGAINAVVDGMYSKIFVDPELVDFFRKTDKER